MFLSGGADATRASEVWCKHVDLASVWCAIRAISDGSAATCCGGRWAVYDASQFAIHDNPPATERCGACVRVLAAERVQRGLAELAANAPIKPLFDAEMPDDLFDHGGEG